MVSARAILEIPSTGDSHPACTDTGPVLAGVHLLSSCRLPCDEGEYVVLPSRTLGTHNKAESALFIGPRWCV